MKEQDVMRQMADAAASVIAAWDSEDGALVAHYPSGKQAIQSLRDALPAFEALGQPKCETCDGRGVIGGPVGQTPEQLDFREGPCPDCGHLKEPHSRDGFEAIERLLSLAGIACDPGWDLGGDSMAYKIDCVRERMQELFDERKPKEGEVERLREERDEFKNDRNKLIREISEFHKDCARTENSLRVELETAKRELAHQYAERQKCVDDWAKEVTFARKYYEEMIKLRAQLAAPHPGIVRLQSALTTAKTTLLRSMQRHGCDPCHITEAIEAIDAAMQSAQAHDRQEPVKIPEILRYDTDDGNGPEEHPNGAWVRYRDFARVIESIRRPLAQEEKR